MRGKLVQAAAVAARVTMTAGTMTAVASLIIPQTTIVAYARYDLPKPYVSRALDAVLVPINDASRRRYKLSSTMHGVYVLAIDPHGVAARQGIRAGDVLATVRNHPILVPADVDRLVWTALAVSVTDFLFGVSRGGSIVHVDTDITVNNFNQTINITNINSWTSVENQQNWTQIVNQYDSDLSTSVTDNSYRSDTSYGGSDIPEPTPDGVTPEMRQGDDIPEPTPDGVNPEMRSGDATTSSDDDLDDEDYADDDDGGDDYADDDDGGDDYADDDDGGDDYADDDDGGDDYSDDDDGGDDYADDDDGGDDYVDDDDGGDDYSDYDDGGDDYADDNDGGDEEYRTDD